MDEFNKKLKDVLLENISSNLGNTDHTGNKLFYPQKKNK